MIGRRKGSAGPTALELQMLQVLWTEGACTVAQVQQALKPNRDLAYTTVQTVLNTLEHKGKVRRELNGRAFCYEAVSSREKILRQAIRELAEQMFGGSSDDLVLSLIKSRQVDAEKIAALSRRIADEEATHE